MEGIECVLLDIEGTILEIAFVKDVLFPYALKALPEVLASKWEDDVFASYKEAFPESAQESPEALQAHVEDLTKRDVKIAYLKNLQGYLWETGYKSGAYATSFFPDVVPKLNEWKKVGLGLAIYSSGSVFAQKLLFGHVRTATPVAGQKRGRTDENDEQDDASEPLAKNLKLAASSEEVDTAAEGPSSIAPAPPEQDVAPDANAVAGSEKPDTEDLQYLISDWFDTINAGPKMESSSYKKIASELYLQASNVLFLSDNVKEVDAAVEAGMRAVLVDRPGNAPLSTTDRDRLNVVESLEEVEGKIDSSTKT